MEETKTVDESPEGAGSVTDNPKLWESARKNLYAAKRFSLVCGMISNSAMLNSRDYPQMWDGVWQTADAILAAEPPIPEV